MKTDANTDARTTCIDRCEALATKLKRTFNCGVTLPVAWRKRQLRLMARMLKEHRSDIEQAVQLDLGKPAVETSLMEIKLVLDEIKFMMPRITPWSRPKPKAMPLLLQPSASWTVAQPKGVALIISPWNYPVLLSLEPMVDALAAGNCVCLKPSELSPHIGALLEILIKKYLDSRAICVFQGDAKATSELLEQHFDHIFYTGGERVGKIVMHAGAEHLTPVTLELGGKSPTFVDASADLNVVAGRIAWGKFTNAGQTCVAPDYVLATPDVAQQLGEKIVQQTRHFFGTNPRYSPSYGRIVNDRQFQRLVRLLPQPTPTIDRSPTASQRQAGHFLCGGENNRSERYIAPAVIMNPDPSDRVMQEEIFGPILPILTVPNAHAAVEFINARPRPLALYVFSRSSTVRRMFTRRTAAGALCFNLPLGHLLSSRLPFGGVGDSGMGAYHGKAGFMEFSHNKAVTWKPEHPDTLRLIYPPYGRAIKALGHH